MKSIDLEAHFYTQAAFDYLETRNDYPKLIKSKNPGEYDLLFSEGISLFQNDKFINILCDLSDKRLSAMDEAGIDTQVLSFSSPGIDEFFPDSASADQFATEINNLIYQTTHDHPDRFKGFATLSPYNVPASVTEFERAITKLGFVGWLAHANFGEGMRLDSSCYWPLLEVAEALNVPIYIHPTTPLNLEFSEFGFALAGPAMGFQFDTGLTLLRMIYAGVFDRFPDLKIILGHMGETIPFLVPERIDWAYANPNVSTLKGFIKERPNIKKTPAEVIKDNVYITTSGRFSKPLLTYALEVMGEDHVMLATDYPYEDLGECRTFIDNCGQPKSIVEKICHKNWEALFSKS